jgi:hypothetical protein
LYNENLTGRRYLELLRNEVQRTIENLLEEEKPAAWYQMDGAPAHNTHQVGAVLNEIFTDRWMANNGLYLWPPRSPDLTPLDYFIWGYIKNIVYADPVTTKENEQSHTGT